MRAGKATPMQIDLETGEILEDGSEEELAAWVQLSRATRDHATPCEQDVPPEATDAVAPSSPARRGAITSGGAHEAQPLRGHHGRSVQSITARTAHVYSAGAESRVALPPTPTPLPHP